MASNLRDCTFCFPGVRDGVIHSSEPNQQTPPRIRGRVASMDAKPSLHLNLVVEDERQFSPESRRLAYVQLIVSIGQQVLLIFKSIANFLPTDQERPEHGITDYVVANQYHFNLPFLQL